MRGLVLVSATIFTLVGFTAAQTRYAPAPVAAAAKAAPNMTQAPKPASVATKARVSDPDTYIIGPLDVLQISVWKEPDMSAPSLPVRPDGEISLPLAGEIHATGLTAAQLGAIITGKLSKFAQDPQVTVVVLAINSKRIYLLGEIVRPGPTAMLPDMTVLQALSTGGGLTQYANAKKIYILRNENGSQQRLPFNYKQALTGRDQDIFLHPGDTIVVP